MRRFYFAVLALVLVLAAQPLVAATYYVGTCKGGAHYNTISDAVAGVPVGSTIDVCPGTYAEQVVISQALTLQGIVNNNSSQAVITVPSGGLATTTEITFGTVAAQVEVTAGPVNITNITVDGTATSTNCPSTFFAGIFYSSGSSGTVNEVETRYHNCGGLDGIGILAENGAAATAASVKIENSNIHDNNYVGIFTCSNPTPSTLTATITGNYVGVTNSYGIIPYCNAAGSVSGNTIVGDGSGGTGVLAFSPSTTVSGNTLSGENTGITVETTAVISSNHISNSPYGIFLFVSGATIKTNAITKASVGIEFNCFTGTITGNTINGATTGLDQVPALFNLVNKFNNVATVRTNGGC